MLQLPPLRPLEENINRSYNLKANHVIHRLIELYNQIQENLEIQILKYVSLLISTLSLIRYQFHFLISPIARKPTF